MIPLTVSFFLKQSNSLRAGIFNALLYGFFIVLIYVLLSLPFHFLDSLNPEILNTISTNVPLNLLFLEFFVFFAFSFFWVLRIDTAIFLGNATDEGASRSGSIGIFHGPYLGDRFIFVYRSHPRVFVSGFTLGRRGRIATHGWNDRFWGSPWLCPLRFLPCSLMR